MTCNRCGGTKLMMYRGHTITCTACAPPTPFNYRSEIMRATKGAMECPVEQMSYAELVKLVVYLRGRLSYEIERGDRLEVEG